MVRGFWLKPPEARLTARVKTLRFAAGYFYQRNDFSHQQFGAETPAFTPGEKAPLLLYLTRGRESAGRSTRTPGRKRSLLLLAAGPTQKDSRACLPLANGRWPNTCAQDLRPCADRASAHGEGNRAREARWLPATAPHSVQPIPEEVYAMLPPEIRCVVGIDVATSAHVVCALEVPSGAPGGSRARRSRRRLRAMPTCWSGWARGASPLRCCSAWSRRAACGSRCTTP